MFKLNSGQIYKNTNKKHSIYIKRDTFVIYNYIFETTTYSYFMHTKFKSTSSILFLLLFVTQNIIAQNKYIVSTNPTNRVSENEEELFLQNNFPLIILSNWEPGMNFMFSPTVKEQFIPIFSLYDTEKEINNTVLKEQILTFVGVEEKASNLSIGTNYNTRFIFECEGTKYYHEIKNMKFNEISVKNPRASIPGLIYLKDVDTARELLIGKVVYIQSTTAYIDDANSYSGYREVPIAQNSRAVVTAVGVGNKNYPVKIVFEDENGKSYFLDVAMSRTNSGMDIVEFQASKKMKLFLHAFSFTDKKSNAYEALINKYTNLWVYPKKNIEGHHYTQIDGDATTNRINLFRYTPFLIKKIKLKKSGGTLASLELSNKQGQMFEVDVDLKYNVITKNEDYIEDLFGMGDLHKQFPYITDENWEKIAKGELKEGMTTDECRLSVGKPIERRIKKDSRFETWFYNGRALEFESGKLVRFK